MKRWGRAEETDRLVEARQGGETRGEGGRAREALELEARVGGVNGDGRAGEEEECKGEEKIK